MKNGKTSIEIAEICVTAKCIILLQIFWILCIVVKYKLKVDCEKLGLYITIPNATPQIKGLLEGAFIQLRSEVTFTHLFLVGSGTIDLVFGGTFRAW